MKIKTPNQFAFVLALVIAVIFIVFVIGVNFFSNIKIDYLTALIAMIVLWLITYGVVYYLLEKLITQKIRVLYRTIHNYKISRCI